MKNLPNFNIEIDGLNGEIFVSDNDDGRFMCVFVKTAKVDFCDIYNAFGFMAWTPSDKRSESQYFPIKLQEDTKLTEDVMKEMWRQISSQFGLICE